MRSYSITNVRNNFNISLNKVQCTNHNIKVGSHFPYQNVCSSGYVLWGRCLALQYTLGNKLSQLGAYAVQ
jgi:hypothetical protein